MKIDSRKSVLSWFAMCIVAVTVGFVIRGKPAAEAFAMAAAQCGGAFLGLGLGILALMLLVDLLASRAARRYIEKPSRFVDAKPVGGAEVYVCTNCETELRNLSISDPKFRVWDCPKCGAFWTWVNPPTHTR